MACLKACFIVFLATLTLGCQTIAEKPASRLAKNSIQAEALLMQAEQAYQAGKLDVAEQVFLQSLALEPNHQKSLFRLGNIYFRQGDLKKSAKFFSKVVALNPKNAKAHYNLGTIHLMFAEQHLKYFTATAPNSMNISPVSHLLGELDRFSSRDKAGKQASPAIKSNKNLDKLVELIKSQ